MPKFFQKDPVINPWSNSSQEPVASSQQAQPSSLTTNYQLPDTDHQLPEHTQDHQDNPQDFHRANPEDDDPTRILATWRAPSRPFRQKDNSYYLTIGIIVTLLILIALLAQEFLLIGSLLAFSFVIYVLGFHPPEEIDYKISTQGVTIGGHFYFWDDLNSFWFDHKEGQRVLHILTNIRFPGQLIIVLGEKPEEVEIKRIIAKYLPFYEIPPKSFVETSANFLQKFFPLEKTNS